MARKCNFCQRWFQNKKAVRAHLQFCEEYLIKKKLIDMWVCEDCGFIVKKDPPRGICPSCGASSWIKRG